VVGAVGGQGPRAGVVHINAVGAVRAAAVVAESFDQVAVVAGDVLEAGACCADADGHAGAAVAAAGGGAGAADVVRPDTHLDHVLAGQRQVLGHDRGGADNGAYGTLQVVGAEPQPDRAAVGGVRGRRDRQAAAAGGRAVVVGEGRVPGRGG